MADAKPALYRVTVTFDFEVVDPNTTGSSLNDAAHVAVENSKAGWVEVLQSQQGIQTATIGNISEPAAVPMNKAVAGEEHAKAMLKFFQDSVLKSGYVFAADALQGRVAGARSKGELVAGIEYGISQGWFVKGPNNLVRLTDAGFSQYDQVKIEQ